MLPLTIKRHVAGRSMVPQGPGHLTQVMATKLPP